MIAQERVEDTHSSTITCSSFHLGFSLPTRALKSVEDWNNKEWQPGVANDKGTYFIVAVPAVLIDTVINAVNGFHEPIIGLVIQKLDCVSISINTSIFCNFLDDINTKMPGFSWVTLRGKGGTRTCIRDPHLKALYYTHPRHHQTTADDGPAEIEIYRIQHQHQQQSRIFQGSPGPLYERWSAPDT